MNVWNLIETLYKDQTLEKEELVFLLEHRDEETASCLGELARKEAQKIYGNKVFPISDGTKIHKLHWKCKGSKCHKEFEINVE